MPPSPSVSWTRHSSSSGCARPGNRLWNRPGQPSCTAQIIAAARERSGGYAGIELDELYLRALAGSVISCGKAAMDVWFARCGGSLTPDSLSSLRQLLIDSMSLLGSGFARPDSPPAADTSADTSAAAQATIPADTSTATPSPDRH